MNQHFVPIVLQDLGVNLRLVLFPLPEDMLYRLSICVVPMNMPRVVIERQILLAELTHHLVDVEIGRHLGGSDFRFEGSLFIEATSRIILLLVLYNVCVLARFHEFSIEVNRLLLRLESH